MRIDDLKYLCTNLGNLSGIPVRLYQKGKQIFFYSLVRLLKDPFELSKEAAFKLKDDVCYYQSPYYYYYAIANIDDLKIVVGPTRQLPISNQELKSVAFSLGIPISLNDEFISQMESLVSLPLMSLIQIMCMIYFSITPKTVSYVKPDRKGITMREVKADDSALLDLLYEKMHQRPYYTERPREDLHDILCSWRSRPYAFFQGETLVGWAVHYVSKRQFSEFCSLDPALTQAMVAVAIDTLGSLSIAVPAYDHILAGEVDVLAEDVNVISNECFLVLNWQRVLSTLLAFLNDKHPLIDGTLTVKIEGTKETVCLKLSVKDGKTSVEITDEAPEITLSQTEAEAFFFRNYSALRAKVNPQAASWLPLPLFIFEPDNV